MFSRYLAAEGASLMGTSVYAVALPALAVLSLHATPGQVAALYFASQIPYFVLALPAGAIVDRHPKKYVLITTDSTAACLVAVIPAASAVGILSITLLQAVAVLLGAVTVLHQAAATAILPQLVPPPKLHQATSRLGAALGAADTAGVYLGGAVVATVGAARAIALDSLSYLFSAWCASRIPVEPTPAPRTRTRLTTEMWEGVRYVMQDPLLRPLALCLGGTGAGAGMIAALSSWYLLAVLHIGTTGLAVIMGVSGAGGLVGALLAPRAVRGLGPGRVLTGTVAIYWVLGVPLLVAGSGRLWLSILALAGGLQLAAAACASSTVLAVRQQICPAHLRARAQQTATWLVAGSRPLAALGAAALATAVGVRLTLLAGTLVLAGTAAALWASPVRRLTDMPTAPSRSPS
ncbi:MFS transporter [Streptomyces sp. NPDC001553]|uniref:MFS transporter n=1 Tax=Streptomyces sp. NPDC001553 TaxID=3154385 RepID=UPI0033187AF0